MPHPPHVQTHSGQLVDPFNLDPSQIRLRDISHALAHLCRFGGHTHSFYSVAQHTLTLAALVPDEVYKYALFHDASEAYLVDVPAPIKHRPEMAPYREAEARLQAAIYTAVGLKPVEPEIVKWWDKALCHYEALYLRTEQPHHSPWIDQELVKSVQEKLSTLIRFNIGFTWTRDPAMTRRELYGMMKLALPKKVSGRADLLL